MRLGGGKYGDLKIKLPANHRLRLIDKYIRFEFVRARLKDIHSDRGALAFD
jgi:hypothetical protein